MRTKHVAAMVFAACVTVAWSYPGWAQSRPAGETPGGADAGPSTAPVPPPNVAYFKRGVFLATRAVAGVSGPVDILAGEGSITGKVVTGKPFSADSVTESTQILSDGNRITHTNRARIYRDSKGRTRREQTLNGIGPWSASNKPVTIVTINDPVAGVSYVLNPATKTAQTLNMVTLNRGTPAALGIDAPGPLGGAGAKVLIRAKGSAAIPDAGGAAAGSTAPPPPLPPLPPVATWVGAVPDPSQVTHRTEDLGDQVLQGVLTHGVRRTQTIAAGAIGNERPIEIVTEQWYSPDLQVLVQRTSSDPRFGETTYKLINVDRSEPAPELFQLPQDYKVTQGGTVQRILTGGPKGQVSGRVFIMRKLPAGDAGAGAGN